jgi:DNA-binding MarR family transcriptional regulator
MAKRTSWQEDLVRELSVDDAPHRIGMALREVRRGAVSLRERHLGTVGLDWGQRYDALGVLVIDNPDGCRMAELARALRVAPSTTTRAVDGLVNAGLAERTRAEDDGRSTIVRPTRAGVALYLSSAQAISPVMRAGLNAEFTADEQEMLATLLERLIATFDALGVEQADAESA